MSSLGLFKGRTLRSFSLMGSILDYRKVEIIENLSLQFPHCGRLKVNMGNIYYKQERFPLAVKMYRMALDETPSAYKETRYRILRNIGSAFMRLGQYQVFFVWFFS